MGYTLGPIGCDPGDPQCDSTLSPTDPPAVWLSTGELTRCLPERAAEALGWS